jgi:hypothetical protein
MNYKRITKHPAVRPPGNPTSIPTLPHAPLRCSTRLDAPLRASILRPRPSATPPPRRCPQQTWLRWCWLAFLPCTSAKAPSVRSRKASAWGRRCACVSE